MSQNVVGWFLPKTLEARSIWYDPVPFKWHPDTIGHSNLFLECPAYQKFSRNSFVLKCPFDLHLHCSLNDDGCELSVGGNSSIKPEKLEQFIKVHPKDEWRESDKPLIQMMLNYYFITDDHVDIQYLDY